MSTFSCHPWHTGCRARQRRGPRLRRGRALRARRRLRGVRGRPATTTAFPWSTSPCAHRDQDRSRRTAASRSSSSTGWTGSSRPTSSACRRCRARPVPPEGVAEALQRVVARGARVLSVCSGAFTLGEAGLLDGRACTTHWRHTTELAERFPLAQVVPEVLYVDAGQVVTGAGTAAGIDACLHLWRQEHGSRVAGAVARRMVVPPQRDGGQAQFIARAVPDCEAETLGPLLTWIVEHLDEELGVDALARPALMSPRTFARRFREETGTTPHSWVTHQRVRRGRGAARAQRPVGRAGRRPGRLRQRCHAAPAVQPGPGDQPAAVPAPVRLLSPSRVTAPGRGRTGRSRR